jgi:hypothetical protein
MGKLVALQLGYLAVLVGIGRPQDVFSGMKSCVRFALRA